MESLTFEEAFAQLEAMVVALQNGQLPLERALQCYEDGMRLAQQCHALLQKAELVVEQLRIEPDGAVTTQPFEIE